MAFVYKREPKSIGAFDPTTEETREEALQALLGAYRDADGLLSAMEAEALSEGKSVRVQTLFAWWWVENRE